MPAVTHQGRRLTAEICGPSLVGSALAQVWCVCSTDTVAVFMSSPGPGLSHLEIPNVFVRLCHSSNFPRRLRRAILTICNRWPAMAVYPGRLCNLAHEDVRRVRHHQGKENHGVGHGRGDGRIHGGRLECSRQHAVQPLVPEPEVERCGAKCSFHAGDLAMRERATTDADDYDGLGKRRDKAVGA